MKISSTNYIGFLIYLSKNIKYLGNELPPRTEAASVDPSVGSPGPRFPGPSWGLFVQNRLLPDPRRRMLAVPLCFMLRVCFTIDELTLTACELLVRENFTKSGSLILELHVISLATSLPKAKSVNALISTSSFPTFQKTHTYTYTFGT